MRSPWPIPIYEPSADERSARAGRQRGVGVRSRGRLGTSAGRASTIVTRDQRDPERLVLHANSMWLQVLARLFACSMDRRIAAGQEPEFSRLFAARFEQLVSISLRVALVQDWQRLLEESFRPPAVGCRRVPLCRERIRAAEGPLRTMMRTLGTPAPIAPRGVAMAVRLLGDGAGPLYNRHCGADLSAMLEEVTAHLDPSALLA